MEGFRPLGDCMDKFNSRATSQPLSRERKEAHRIADRCEELGFANHAKGLRCCGLRRVDASGMPLMALSCNRRFCPMCRNRWRSETRRKWSPRISSVKGKSGEAGTLSLTLPSSARSLHDRKATFRNSLAQIFRKQTWKGRNGYMRKVGFLVLIEFGHGGIEEGLPHAHLLVVSPAPGVVSGVIQWVVATWLELNPEASPLGQHSSLCCEVIGFGAWLNYILKGNVLDPAWDDQRFAETLLVLSDGSHRLTPYGLLKPSRTSSNVRPLFPASSL